MKSQALLISRLSQGPSLPVVALRSCSIAVVLAWEAGSLLVLGHLSEPRQVVAATVGAKAKPAWYSVHHLRRQLLDMV